jgi:hypothetical protein
MFHTNTRTGQVTPRDLPQPTEQSEVAEPMLKLGAKAPLKEGRSRSSWPRS